MSVSSALLCNHGGSICCWSNGSMVQQKDQLRSLNTSVILEHITQSPGFLSILCSMECSHLLERHHSRACRTPKCSGYKKCHFFFFLQINLIFLISLLLCWGKSSKSIFLFFRFPFPFYRILPESHEHCAVHTSSGKPLVFDTKHLNMLIVQFHRV